VDKGSFPRPFQATAHPDRADQDVRLAATWEHAGRAVRRRTDAAGAGTVTFTQSGGRLSVVSAVPSTGWTVEVEQTGGVEIETTDVAQDANARQ
jgi:hypothetical protein